MSVENKIDALKEKTKALGTDGSVSVRFDSDRSKGWRVWAGAEQKNEDAYVVYSESRSLDGALDDAVRRADDLLRAEKSRGDVRKRVEAFKDRRADRSQDKGMGE